MLQMFRNFFKSKLGIAVTLGFLALIALAFASSDIANTSLGGGTITGADRVAVVGDRRISASELSTAASTAFDQARQANPTLTMQAFVAQGGLDGALSQLLSRAVLAELGMESGLRAGKRLVDSDLAQVAAFQGAGGRFDRAAFNAVLAQRGLTEAMVREDFATNLIVRQVLSPIAMTPSVPQSFATHYGALLREQRSGSIAVLSSELLAPRGEPSAEQLQAFYTRTRNNYLRPERRVLRFATVGQDAIGTLPAPTQAQIAERFRRDAARYAAAEDRVFTQLVVPTEAAARAIVAEVRGGKSLAAAAQEKGLSTTQVGPANRGALTTATSAAVAQAAFAAPAGSLAEPARGGLGWYVLRVERIDRRAARTLAEARGEISAALAAEQRAAAFADLGARIEEEFDGGKSLAEVARELRLTVNRTPPATVAGAIYGTAGEAVAPILRPVLPTLFEMEEGEPQVAETVPGIQLMVFDVAEVIPAAVAPLADIRAQVVALWRRDQGARAARQAADAVIAQVAKGTPLAQAVRSVRADAPAPRRLALGRQELAAQGPTSREMALFFSMAEGTVKKIEAGTQAGWFVVQLDNVQPGAVTAQDPLVLATLQQLATVGIEEHVQQFVKAAEKEVGVERNEEAITALAAQLSGQGG